MIHFAEAHDIIDEAHQKMVAHWMKENASLLKGMSGGNGVKYLIDSRYWHIEESETDKGGAILRSRCGKYMFYAEFVPHDYGQVGRIEFSRERYITYLDRENDRVNVDEALLGG